MDKLSTLVGNVGREPELRSTDKSKVCSFSLACNGGKNAEGDRVTTWVKVSVWGELGEKACSVLHKGTFVQVVGYLHSPRIYEDKDGHPQAGLDFTAFGVSTVGNVFEEIKKDEPAEIPEKKEDDLIGSSSKNVSRRGR